MSRRTTPRGFTLIEVAMVVAIAGILAALASQSYEAASAKNKRSAGLVALKTVSMKQAAYFAENHTFATTLDALGIESFGSERLSATSVKWGSYTIELGDADDTTYYAAATAQIDRDSFVDVIGVNRGNHPHVIYDDVRNSYSPMPDPIIPAAPSGDTGGGDTGGGDTGGGDTGGGSGGGGGNSGGGGGNSGGGGGNSGGGGGSGGGRP